MTMTSSEADALFTRFPAFAAVAQSDRKSLIDRAMVRRVPAGTTYLREGDVCSTIALVLEGRLRVSKSAPNGREITLYQIGPGETCIFTASCLLTGARYPALAMVVQDALAALVPGDVFRHLVDSNRDVRTFVLDQFTDRLAATMAVVEEVAFRRVDQRAARWLAEAAAANNNAPLTVSHEEVASHLGTARVVVSRILEDFAGRGWLALGRRKIDVVNGDALRSFGNQSD